MEKNSQSKTITNSRDVLLIFLDKTLSLIEYLIKHANPKCVQEFKGKLYQIRALEAFSYLENGSDKGLGGPINKRLLD